jgi:hypothetical protein
MQPEDEWEMQNLQLRLTADPFEVMMLSNMMSENCCLECQS